MHYGTKDLDTLVHFPYKDEPLTLMYESVLDSSRWDAL